MRLVSLFAGIGGFDLGFERAGFRTVATVEIDANCQRLLAERWPDAVHLDDVRTAGRHNLPECDVITFGFPCQDLSVAGKREGLKGERSGLFYEATRIIDECRPAVALFENVPGLLSSRQGRDFARVLQEMDKIGYHGAWRVLDAQWFGVAQRRRRIFGLFARVGAGDRAGGRALLPEPESVAGDPAQGGKAGQGPAAGAGDGLAGISGGTASIAGWCADVLGIPSSLQGHPAPERRNAPPITHDVAPCLRARGVGTASPTDSRGQDAVIAVQDVVHSDKACNGKGWSADGSAYTLDTLATQGVCLPGVSGTLDRKSCSANRGCQGNETDFLVPEVARPIDCNASRGGIPRTDGLDGALIPEVSGTLKGSAPGSGTDNSAESCDRLIPEIAGTLDRECGGTRLQVQCARSGHLLPAVGCRMAAFGKYVDDGTASTVKARDHNKDATDLTAFDASQRTDGARVTGDKTATLSGFAGTGGNNVPCVAQVQWASGGGRMENPTAQALRSGAESNYQFVRVGMKVRRLTPVECERLQGFPDNWTAGFSDSARYRMLGNAVCVPVAAWIGKRLAAAMRRRAVQ